MSAPDVVNAWFYRQMATWATLFKKGDLAIEYWKRVRQLRPRDPSVVATLAHLQAGAGRRGEAMALVRESLEMNPAQPAVWFNLGFMQQQGGDHAAALASFERALALDDKLDRAYYGRALSLIKLGRLEEAVAPLKRNTQLQPMSPYGWYQLAHVYHRLGQDERAIKVIRKLAEFEPKWPSRPSARPGRGGREVAVLTQCAQRATNNEHRASNSSIHHPRRLSPRHQEARVHSSSLTGGDHAVNAEAS